MTLQFCNKKVLFSFYETERLTKIIFLLLKLLKWEFQLALLTYEIIFFPHSNKRNCHLRLEIPTVAKQKKQRKIFLMSCFVQKYLTINSLKFLVHFSKYCSCFMKTTVNTAVPNQQTVEAIVGILAKLSLRKA